MKFLTSLIFSALVFGSPVPMVSSSPEGGFDAQSPKSNATPSKRIGDRIRMAIGVPRPTEIVTATTLMAGIPTPNPASDYQVPTTGDSGIIDDALRSALEEWEAKDPAERSYLPPSKNDIIAGSGGEGSTPSEIVNQDHSLDPFNTGSPVQNQEIDRNPANLATCTTCQGYILAGQSNIANQCQPCLQANAARGSRGCCCFPCPVGVFEFQFGSDSDDSSNSLLIYYFQS